MIKAFLENAGLIVATPGLEHRSMLGMAGSFVKIPIKVPRRDEEEARELLEALDADEEHEPAEESGRDSLVGEAPRQRRIAIFVSCVLTFGAGHFYVRETMAGLVLLTLEVAAVVAVCAGLPLAGVVIFGCVLTDLVGSVRTVGRLERGEEPLSRGAQLLRAVLGAALGSAGFLGLLQLIPEEAEPIQPEAPRYEPFPVPEPAPEPLEDPFRPSFPESFPGETPEPDSDPVTP